MQIFQILKKIFHFFNDSWIGIGIVVVFLISFVGQSFIIPSASMQSTMLVGDYLFGKKYIYGIPIPHIPWLEIPILPDFNGNGHLIEGSRPQKGDIVIFRYPINIKQHYVKRLVATEGDEVIYTQDGLYIRPKDGDKYIAAHFSGDKKKKFMGKVFVYDPYFKRHPGVQYAEGGDAFKELIYLNANGYKVAMDLYQENGEYFFYHRVQEGHFFMMGDNRNFSSDSRFWGSIEYRHIVGSPWFIFFSLDDDYKVRWNRVGRSIRGLEEESIQDLSEKALQEASSELAAQQEE